MPPLPIFKPGQRKIRHDQMNEIVRRLEQAYKMTVGPGMHMLDTSAGRVIGLDTERGLRPVRDRVVVVVNESENETDPVMVREVRFRVFPGGSGHQLRPGEYEFSDEQFEAWPDYGLMPAQLDSFVTEADPPTADDAFLNARYENHEWFVSLRGDAPANSRDVVIVSIGNPDANFVTVEDVLPEIVDDEWTGSYIRSRESWDIPVHPFARAGDYAGFEWTTDEEINAFTPTINAVRTKGMWKVEQYFRFEVPELASNLIFNDCGSHLTA